MLALCQKRRRQEDEEDARRRQRYWDWRAVDPADYNPVYPFLPPPTPGSDVIIPTPMPPFFSDIDFYLSNLSVLNIRTSAPIIHTINGLALSLGTGLKLEDGKLTVEGGGPGGKTYTGTAPITVDNTQNKIGLSIGSGLQVVNNALDTKPLTPVHPIKIAGNVIYLALGQGFYYDQQADALIVYLGNGLQFSSTGAIELTNPPQGDLTALAPIYITDGQVTLSYDDKYFKMDSTSSPQKLQLNMGDPFEVTQTGIDLKMGPNIRVNDGGQLTVDLPTYTTPLTKTGQGPNQTVSLSTSAPFKITGNALTLDYESPINLVNDKLSVTVEDPLEAGTNGLKLRLGQGLSTDQSGALQVTTVSQNLTAESPLHILNDSISLHTDSGFLVDTATHSLKLNVAEPLAVDSTTGLGLNYDPNMFQTSTSAQQLQLKLPANSAITASADGLTIQVNLGLDIGQTGQINLKVEGSGGLDFDEYGQLKVKKGNGITSSETSGLTVQTVAPLSSTATGVRLNMGPGFQTANNLLSLNLEAPLAISQNKLALTYSSPITVVDDSELTVTVESPLIIGTNAIELSLAPCMTTSTSGALSLTGSNTIVVPENAAAEVQCVQPLERSSSGVMLNYDSTTLAVENNKLKVKATPVALNATTPIQFNTTTNNLNLNYNTSMFNTTYGPLSLFNPVFVYQTLANSPMRIQNASYNEYALCDIRMIRLGYNVFVDMYINGTTTSTGTQTWTIQFDGSFGSCLTGSMVVYDGQGNRMDGVMPTFIVCTTQLGTSDQRMRGFEPIVCSENGTFKQSTYCSWWVYKTTNMYIQLKSTTSNCKPIFKISFMYEAEYGIV